MKVTLLNVKYSPNLGDGIIAECLEHALETSNPSATVTSCDLAARNAYGEGLDRSRSLIHTALNLIPGPLRQFATSAVLETMIHLRLKSHYRSYLQNADLVLIGGGQIIADKNLNFPRKIKAAIDSTNSNARIAIYAAGVAKSMSHKGLSLFRKAFADRVFAVRLRDQQSQLNFNSHFHTPSAGKVWDPGFLINKLYPKAATKPRARKLIGIGVTHPNTLQLHAEKESKTLNREKWTTFYCDLCQLLMNAGFDVELFTNGAGDDQMFAERVLKELRNKQFNEEILQLAPRADRPKKLAQIISRYDGLVAHRLHANITAFAYRIPHVGLGWDAKMQGFFAETERAEFLVEVQSERDANSVYERLKRAISCPVSDGKLQAIQAQIYRQADEFLSYSASSVTTSSMENSVESWFKAAHPIGN